MNPQISTLGKSVEALHQMAPDRLTALIKGKFKGLPPEKIDQLYESLKHEFQVSQDSLRQARKGLRDVEDGRADPASREELSDILRFLRETEKQLRLIAKDAKEDEVVHHHRVPQGQDVNIPALDLDGETYVFELGQENQVQKNEEEIPDPVTTPDLIRETSIFMNPIGQEISLVNVDLASGEHVFKLSDPKNSERFAYVKFRNANQARFFFSDATKPEDAILESWPILDRVFTNSNSKSVASLLAKPVPLEDRLDKIPGFESITETKNVYAMSQQFGLTIDPSLYRKHISNLFSLIDDPTKDPDPVITQLLQTNNPELINAVILGIALYSGAPAGTYLERIFGKHISEIEKSANKLTTLILETQTNSAGNFGGSNAWSVLFAQGTPHAEGYIPGAWSNFESEETSRENLKLLNQYQQVIQAMGKTPPEGLNSALLSETYVPPPPPPNLNTEFKEKLETLRKEPAGRMDLPEDVWQGLVEYLNVALFTPEGQIKNNAWDLILKFMEDRASAVEAAAEISVGLAAGAAGLGAAVPIIGTVAGLIIGGAIGVFTHLSEIEDRDDMLANLIAAIDDNMSQEFKDQLFSKIAGPASKWLTEDSDGLFEDIAANEIRAQKILKSYL